jgi:hypothetical protein
MVELARRLTGKEVTFMRQAWYQDEDSITIPEGDEEGLFHEILHFLVATDAERSWPNLALDDDTSWVLDDDPHLRKELPDWTLETPVVREYQVCFLERQIYGLHGKDVPKNSSCGNYEQDPDLRATAAWCEERIRSMAERMQIQESEFYDLLFSALVTFECEFL